MSKKLLIIDDESEEKESQNIRISDGENQKSEIRNPKSAICYSALSLWSSDDLILAFEGSTKILPPETSHV